jgi:hypothetical protein
VQTSYNFFVPLIGNFSSDHAIAIVASRHRNLGEHLHEVGAEQVSTVILSVSVAKIALAADAPKVEVVHTWTSSSGSAALRMLVEGVKRNGDEWVDAATTSDSSDKIATNRMLGGNPPTAFLAGGYGTIKSMTERGMCSAAPTRSLKRKGWERRCRPKSPSI